MYLAFEKENKITILGNVAYKKSRVHCETIELGDINYFEADELIVRKEYPQIPPKVEYCLSARGNSLMKVLDQATQGSSGFGSSLKDAQSLVPSANVKEAISVYCDDIPDARDMLMDWMVKNELGE